MSKCQHGGPPWQLMKQVYAAPAGSLAYSLPGLQTIYRGAILQPSRYTRRHQPSPLVLSRWGTDSNGWWGEVRGDIARLTAPWEAIVRSGAAITPLTVQRTGEHTLRLSIDVTDVDAIRNGTIVLPVPEPAGLPRSRRPGD